MTRSSFKADEITTDFMIFPSNPPPLYTRKIPTHHLQKPPRPWLIDSIYHNRGYGVCLLNVTNVVLKLDKPKSKLAHYLSATLFSPAKFTLLPAIRKNHLITWPGLTTSLISKHLPKSITNSKGHLDQEFKNLRDLPNMPPFI